MKFIVKFFPEITIKSRPVRKAFVKQLRHNIRLVLRKYDDHVVVAGNWDFIEVLSEKDDMREDFTNALSNIAGIAHFQYVREFVLTTLDDIVEEAIKSYGDAIKDSVFAVRVRRVGTHDFSSVDAERHIGGCLKARCGALAVRLKNPEVLVPIDIRDNRVWMIEQRVEGLGGYPIGSQDSVLSLISGGFDSTVSSYLTMSRGLKTHFCFFNLGGDAHEIGVKQVSHFLWDKYGSNINVKFVTVPFENVVAEILTKVDNSEMGVILKRMMLRAASEVMEGLNAKALVTGESVAQVSSQTLINLQVIDQVTDNLVIRPLVTMNKQDIIDKAIEIGTEPFAASMPEYCGVISVKPTTRAKMHRIDREESKFDMAVLEQAINSARVVSIQNVMDDVEKQYQGEVPVVRMPVGDEVIVDIRHPDEAERKPLKVSGRPVIKMPFFTLESGWPEVDKSKTHLLYCGKGVMSRIHASQLLGRGYENVGVYLP
ncbi:tRNA uracil 4-sulfurtransferase ThiI [Marinomonas mediterranea]|jgi:[ThiS-adenylate] sulfurtransferase|uniref:Probable tRNA sulfurtransferase n=1 Tax=Marinomonas mediterranea (strain ATCC 700492 / JCM 21426 / NBRC 103028 / MMB-1) TaxID=717774 RepID=F2JUB9_MARM1|nr:tRNA uracil 4-sulfurtransferase ThiI [Marinomonas mediterranea]ADZ92738.1 tRNA sulfurtransferase [Marinomonas mediterranea MMB-1]WCN10668.1 tRNA 4-thiouridine(8) synthase ThiI [Marinomonas mediterranea]WCN14725.1 tRNA 4-thiouridine(8) synthase ThiI [Marinomonas mediterranea]WCN18766.1 tRNA 4-thiouridine(8) synthase ThiI [Marinomonas mediterranea MMB-1]